MSAIILILLTGCFDNNSSSSNTSTAPDGLVLDTSCDTAPFPSQLWTQCELENWPRTIEAEFEQLAPAFAQRSLEQQLSNFAEITARFIDDPSWGLPPAFGNTPVTPLCSAGMGPCVGDPFRYPGVEGADGRAFYEQEAEVIPVVYYDRECARISGRIWRPRNVNGRLPAIVIKNGSVQAGEQLYWWAAQALVRAGYVVLTNDPRGQGRSDLSTPNGDQGGNINGAVFFEGLVDDIDFLLSSSAQPYPHQANCQETYPTSTAAFNPLAESIDVERIGIAGHSYGAGGVTWVQSYGAAGSDPWPGLLSEFNPVKVIVAWDALGSSSQPTSATVTNLVPSSFPLLQAVVSPTGAPAVVPRVPALGFTSEYGFTPIPFISDPDRSGFLQGFSEWREASIPVYQIAIAGSTHLDYSLGPQLPATSWCAEVIDNSCVGGWARPAITHYTVAWFDRWLKRADEAGFDDADARLLDDRQWAPRLSRHYSSARYFTTRGGENIDCTDIRLKCETP